MKNIIIAIMLCLGLIACNPSKVTDPNDPRFDLKEFKFSDYETGIDLKRALYKIVPIGTSIQDVNKALVEMASYWASDEFSADEQNTGFVQSLQISPDWNKENIFVDYGLRSMEEESYTVRVLYLGENKGLMEIIVYKYHPKKAPTFFRKELKHR